MHLLDLLRLVINPRLRFDLGTPALAFALLAPAAWAVVVLTGGRLLAQVSGVLAAGSMVAATAVTLDRFGGQTGGVLSSLSRCQVTDPWSLDLEGLLNVGLLAPFALFAVLAVGHPWIISAVAGLASIGFEWTQAVTGKGVCDTSDVVHNVLGAFVTAMLAGAVRRAWLHRPQRWIAPVGTLRSS